MLQPIQCPYCFGRGYKPESRGRGKTGPKSGFYARTCPSCGGAGEIQPADYTYRRALAKVKKTEATANRQNPVPGFDTAAANELLLYIENEYALVGAPNSVGKAIAKNLAKKIATGKYDPAKAPVAWSHLVDAGAKRYNKEFGHGTAGFGAFTKNVRDAVAIEMGEQFDNDVRSGEIDVTALAAGK